MDSLKGLRMKPSIRTIIRQALLSGKGTGLLLAVITFLIYFHAFPNGFLLDDYNFVEQEYQEIFKTPQDFFVRIPPRTHHYAPLYYWTNTVLFHHFQAYPYRMRFLLWMAFLANVLFFFHSIHLLLKDKKTAFLCAALFAIHPIHAFYIHMPSGGFVFFYTLCLQASLFWMWKYLSGAARNTGLYLASLLGFLAGLLFFEAAALYPLYLLIFMRFISPERWGVHLKRALPFFIFSLIDVFLWSWICRGESGFPQRILLLGLSVPRYTASVTRLIFWYMSRLLYPDGLVFIYNMPPAQQDIWLWNGLAGFLLFLFVLLMKRRPQDIKTLALAWFLTGCLFVFPASLTHAYMGMVIETHWIYFSSIGLFLLLTLGLILILKKIRPGFQYACLGLTATYFMAWTQTYHVMARSEKTYCEYWLKVCPENLIPLINLSKIYAEEGQLKRATDYARRAFLLGRDCVPATYANLAMVLTFKGDDAQAEDVITRAAGKGFTSPYLLNTLGVIHRRQGNSLAAEQDFLAAIQQAPRYVLPRLNLAKLYRSSGREKEAVRCYETALSLQPDKKQIFHIQRHLMVLYLKQNAPDLYHGIVQKALTQDPVPRTYLRLSRTLETYHYWREAQALLNQAQEHYPEDAALQQYYRDFMKRYDDAR